MLPAEHSRKHRQRTGPQKKGVRNLPVIPVFGARKSDSALQLARTAMSPAKHFEHSRKQRQWTGPQKKGAVTVRERRVPEASYR